MNTNQTLWWQSVLIGASGGIAVWIAGIIREEYLKWRDKRRVYKCVKNMINEKDTFTTTWAIANNTNLTEDRVNYICSIHKKISRFTLGHDYWKLVNDRYYDDDY